jgi:hypothetical protein
MAVYFPRGQQEFATVETKFRSDLKKAKDDATVDSFVFVTNQEMRLAERRSLCGEWSGKVELFHLERITTILDTPAMFGVRKQFLGIDGLEGEGGAGGSGVIVGDRGVVVGGRGGEGGIGGKGGDGGGGVIHGDDGLVVGGDGGSAASPDGRGGRGARGPTERMGGPTSMWRYGKGGSAANVPEYDRRLSVLTTIRQEYMDAFPEELPFIHAGVDTVPLKWVNKRLEELAENWRVQPGENGYVLPVLP